MIKKINFKPSDGLKKEMEAIGDSDVSDEYLSGYYSQFPDLESYIAKHQTGREISVLKIIDRIACGRKCSILDVGVGPGLTTLLMASLGHRVSAIEPSLKSCRIIDQGSKQYGMNITVYNTVAEAIDQIKDTFDIIVFNASFHHCDDPQKTLNNCYERLKVGGTVALINESMLKFYKTKASFYKNLMENPIEAGNYGGNEHSYHYSEYMSLLKRAGFVKIQAVPSDKYSDIASLMNSIRNHEHALNELAESRKMGRNNTGILKKAKKVAIKLYSILLVIICSNKVLRLILLPLIKRLSMINLDYIGTK